MSETETIDVVETLEPSAQVYTVELGDNTYIQSPLTFFRKIELFSVLADAIDKALSEGAIISEFLDEIPGSTSDLKEADVFVKAIVKIVRFAPDILSDIFCISLNVKKNERKELKEQLEELDDEQAMDILNHFIDQNWDAMMDFFSKQVSPLVAKVSEKVQSQSTSSKPSKVSPARTQKK
jgi:hypothetical protein